MPVEKTFDDNIREKYCVDIIAGVDEAGRGPLAGPVVAAAVILKENLSGLNDSKKLSAKKRERLYDLIVNTSVVGVSVINEDKIDEINIYRATKLAMANAISALGVEPEIALIDGNMSLDIDIFNVAVVKGDSKSASVAAASIIAKVTRDRIMQKLHEKYPQYEFDRHKGYPTKRHISLLSEYGVSPVHRKTFSPVKEIL